MSTETLKIQAPALETRTLTYVFKTLYVNA